MTDDKWIDAILRTACGCERWIRVPADFPQEIRMPIKPAQRLAALVGDKDAFVKKDTIVRTFCYDYTQVWQTDDKEFPIARYTETE